MLSMPLKIASKLLKFVTNFLRSFIPGKGRAHSIGGLRDCDNVRKSIRRSHQGPMG